jgi:hypothetical protein
LTNASSDVDSKHNIFFNTEPHIQIMNGPEVHLHEGSTLNLTCMISPAVDASLLLWERNGQVTEFTQISLDVRIIVSDKSDAFCQTRRRIMLSGR